jgi:TonB-dependent starch-binding outer membrane protein SusC
MQVRIHAGLLVAGWLGMVSFSVAQQPTNSTGRTSTATAPATLGGRVITQTGEPLPGVTVQLKGTTRGTTTDPDGNFRLTDLSPGTVLQVSFVGYSTQEITVGEQPSLTITLREDALALGEVVVVGYGTQRRATLTGAVAEVGGRELVQSPQPNVSNSLVGRTPGLIAVNRSGEPGRDGSQFFIRGRSTLGDTNPLIVIDGVANRLGGLDRLDPNEIESVSILKDASASIYGAQAANGVILVTTRRGKKGKPTVAYQFNQGFTSPTRVPRMADAATYAQIQNEIRYYQAPQQGLNQVFSADEIQTLRDGTDPIGYPNTDWLRTILRAAAPQHRHTLGLSGGSDDVRYLVSAGNVFQDGIYKNGTANYNQYSLRANLDANVGQRLTVGLDLNARQEDRNYPLDSAGRIFRYALRAYPYLVATYPAGPNGLARPGSGTDQGRNPVLQVTDALGYQRDRRTILNGTIRLREDLGGLLPGLAVDGFAAIDKSFQSFKQWSTPWTTYNYSRTTGQYTPQQNGPATPELLQQTANVSQTTLNARIVYDRTIGANTLSGFLAYEQQTYDTDNISAFRSGFLSAAIPQLFAGSQVGAQADGSAFRAARQNYFGRVQLNRADRYLLEIQARYDGSQNFAQGQRFGFFPAFLAGWRISEEPWFKGGGTDWVNSLKLRASYGWLGNDRIAQFQYLTAYTYDQGYFLGQTPTRRPGLTSSGTANPNVTWEVAQTANLAFDATLFDGKLSLTTDFFFTNRNNILARRNVSVPDYTGIALPNENIGRVRNHGFDLQLTHANTYGPINLSAGLNFTFARNRVVFLDENQGIPSYQRQEGLPIGGGPSGGLYYQANGIFQTQADVDAVPHVAGAGPGDIRFIDVNADGVINENDRVRSALNNVPEIVYGVPVSLSYRNFDLNILVQGQARAEQYLLLESGATGNFFADDAANRWRPDNPTGTFPRVASNMLNSINGSFPNTFWLQNAAFVRLKNVEFGYNVPGTWLNRLGMQSARLYISGFNLLTISAIKTVDPENGSAQGWSYPQQRVLNVGVAVRL